MKQLFHMGNGKEKGKALINKEPNRCENYKFGQGGHGN